MLPDGSIEVHQVWKRFRADRTRRLLRDRLSELTSRAKGPKWRWVLRDIELMVEPGESVGLIGVNGSGKSTLLKILTEVMYPYAGTVNVHGRVGALLEVRAGLHADLTGRENVYLYGTLIGFPKDEIARRFDEIVEFANLQDAIDRQVKFYSSGMQMRLGFAVAAYLEPDVLLVDEALAVGDAFFQQRCLDRMSELIRGGTTLILVSHDLASIESVCTRSVWLQSGEVRKDGPVRDVLGDYREFVEDLYHDWLDEDAAEHLLGRGDLNVVQTSVTSPTSTSGSPVSQEPVDIEIVIGSPSATSGTLCFGMSEGPATPVFVVTRDVDLSPGKNTVRCHLPFLPLPSGRFYLWVEFTGAAAAAGLPWQPAQNFMIEGAPLDPAPLGVMRIAPVQVKATWDLDSD
jgi:ABC-type polysaccharide/polyol phosphate transport system ATPase subunit